MSEGPYEYDASGAADPMDAVLDPEDEAEQGDEYSSDPNDEVEAGTGDTPAAQAEANPYDATWVPPDRALHRTDFGTTLAEMRQGESLDQLLAEEEPDVLAEVGLTGGPPAGAARRPGFVDLVADGDADLAAEQDAADDPDLADALAAEGGDTDFPASEFDGPDPRSGRLVEEDEGAHADLEKDMVARDAGISGGGASAEEAAVHIVDEP